GIGMSRPVERATGIVDVHPVERGGKPIGITLAANFTVGDNVEPSFLLRFDRRVILRLGQKRFGDSPKFARAHSRRESARELGAVDQPFWLWVAAHERRRKQHAILPKAHSNASPGP